MYVMFPIGIMYYFGTNLDQRFSVPGFWPTKEQSNKVPRDQSELDDELVRLKALRLERRRLRLEKEALETGRFEEVEKLRRQAFGNVATGIFGGSVSSVRGREG
jgi:protein PET100